MTRVDGPRIRQIRRAQRLSVEQLAVAAGLSPTTLRNLETQPEKDAKPPFVAAIANALRVDVAEITAQNETPARALA